MEWSKELEEIGENLFAEYELDRDPLKEAYMAGVKAAMSELLDEVDIKFEFGFQATFLTEHGPLTLAHQDWKTVIENCVWTSRGEEWERESLQEVKQFIEDGLKEVNGQLDKL
jgi:hypothetical protein